MIEDQQWSINYQHVMWADELNMCKSVMTRQCYENNYQHLINIKSTFHFFNWMVLMLSCICMYTLSYVCTHSKIDISYNMMLYISKDEIPPSQNEVDDLLQTHATDGDNKADVMSDLH